jgi:hypothetical protein
MCVDPSEKMRLISNVSEWARCWLSQRGAAVSAFALGANAKWVQLKYAIEVDRCRYQTIAQPKTFCCGFTREEF